jgi:hypothetical protein
MFVRREQECGPFLGFIIREDRDALILVIEAPKTPAKPPTLIRDLHRNKAFR